MLRKSIANIYEMLNDGHNIKSFIYCSIFSLHEMILSTFIFRRKETDFDNVKKLT